MSRRTERIREAVRRAASEIMHGQLQDPRIKGFITVTKVEVTDDLRLAKIYYSVLGDEKKKKLVEKGLRSAKNFMRHHIAEVLRLRYAIDVFFIKDENAEYKERIDSIFEKIKKERKNEKN